jgi:hypothetical protein
LINDSLAPPSYTNKQYKPSDVALAFVEDKAPADMPSNGEQ